MPRHPFHIVDTSPWPIMIAMSVFCLATGLISWFHEKSLILLGLSFIGVVMVMVYWWRDVVRESTYLGHHTSYVSRGLRMGMLLFILSEALFFFGFFWAFFHSSLSPTPEIGCIWPPVGIEPISPYAVPALNTIVLLASGFSVTWAHHSLMEGSRPDTIWGLTYTVFLGLIFSCLQVMEYYDAPFTIADGVYGSIFFVATGFHGLHVIIGTIFLMVNLYRVYLSHFSVSHHLGFEFSAWYWHFVDVVWIFLFLCLYWWGG